MAESSQISEETKDDENSHKQQELIHHGRAESMDMDTDGDDGSRSNFPTEMKKPMRPEEQFIASIQMKKSRRKALTELRSRVEDAVLGNYILMDGKPHESKKMQENENLDQDISLWGVPLLPSKGHEGTDIILLKFLKARDFKVSEAFNMLRRTLIWRREFKTDGILDENFGPELENVVYIKGTDKEGHPLCYNVCGAFKDREFWRKTFGSEDKREEFIRWRVQSMERVIQNLSFKGEGGGGGGGGVDSMVQIMDLKNSPRPSNKELRLVTKKAVTLLQDNYPELIFRHIIINVPFWYYASHTLISKFISQRTKSKFILARPSNVADTLLKFVAPETLPVQYGGLKRENDHEFSSADKALEVIVKTGTIETIKIPTPEDGVTVVWDITVVGWDVTYKEEFIPEDEGSYEILLEKEWKSKSEECEKEIQKWKKRASAAAGSISKLNRQISLKETQIEQLKSQKQEILEKCEVEHIILPTISDAMEIGSSTPGPVFDFSQLSRSHQADMRPSEREKVEVEFKQKMDALISEIERTAPNLKALDQYEALQEKERNVTEEFEVARKEEKEIADKFNSIKQRRYDLFMEAFSHISGNIDKIYKQLTKSNTHPLGGTAYLNLENEDDPFLHGIKYTAMPPTKRFRDMEQLSGGEKTVAALALLFSIHSYRPSPFFILDEVDAALDNLNVAKVAGFIRSKSCEGARGNQDGEAGSGFQSIVISLKDSFYDKAEALVGVYRDSDRGCSRTLTFDLTNYREA